jgi:hypothetical protein
MAYYGTPHGGSNIGMIVAVLVAAVVVYYFMTNKKTAPAPTSPTSPVAPVAPTAASRVPELVARQAGKYVVCTSTNMRYLIKDGKKQLVDDATYLGLGSPQLTSETCDVIAAIPDGPAATVPAGPAPAEPVADANGIISQAAYRILAKNPAGVLYAHPGTEVRMWNGAMAAPDQVWLITAVAGGYVIRHQVEQKDMYVNGDTGGRIGLAPTTLIANPADRLFTVETQGAERRLVHKATGQTLVAKDNDYFLWSGGMFSDQFLTFEKQ